MSNDKFNPEQYLRDLKANQVLIGVCREALAELRHTKVPNIRFANLINEKLKALPPAGELVKFSGRYATYVNEYGFLTCSVYEHRYYVTNTFDRKEETYLRLSWPLEVHKYKPEGGYTSENGNTWEAIEAELNRSDQADTLERIHQEEQIKGDLQAHEERITELQNEINDLRLQAKRLIEELPEPTSAITRIGNPIAWHNPTQILSHEFPAIWPPSKH